MRVSEIGVAGDGLLSRGNHHVVAMVSREASKIGNDNVSRIIREAYVARLSTKPVRRENRLYRKSYIKREKACLRKRNITRTVYIHAYPSSHRIGG